MLHNSIILQYVVESAGLVKPFFTDDYQDALEILHSQYLVNKAEKMQHPVSFSSPRLELHVHWKPDCSCDVIISSVCLSYDIWTLNKSIVDHLQEYISNFKL